MPAHEIFTLLGGRIKLYKNAFMPSEDGLWLAAAVKAEEGAQVLEAGCGVGAAALAVLNRMPNVNLTAVEQNEAHLNAAAQNAALNGLEGHFTPLHGDFLALDESKQYDSTFSNPPFHNTGGGFESESKLQEHGSCPEGMETWVRKMLALTKEGGSITLIHHSANQALVEKLFEGLTYRITHLQTNGTKAPKRFILQAEKAQSASLPERTLNTVDKTLRRNILELGEALP